MYVSIVLCKLTETHFSDENETGKRHQIVDPRTEIGKQLYMHECKILQVNFILPRVCDV